MLTDKEFRALLDVVAEIEGIGQDIRETLESLLEKEAKMRGYQNWWPDAYRVFKMEG